MVLGERGMSVGVLAGWGGKGGGWEGVGESPTAGGCQSSHSVVVHPYPCNSTQQMLK